MSRLRLRDYERVCSWWHVSCAVVARVVGRFDRRLPGVSRAGREEVASRTNGYYRR